MPRNKELTEKQRAFITGYLVHFNAYKAAIDAGYSVQSARAASNILSIPAVKAAIAASQEKRERESGITAERILQELARVAFFDPRKLFRPNGCPIAITDLDDDTVAAIAGMDVSEEFSGYGDDRCKVADIRKWKLADKLGALTLLMRNKGMLNDKLTVKCDLSGLSDEDLEQLERIQSKLSIAKPGRD